MQVDEMISIGDPVTAPREIVVWAIHSGYSAVWRNRTDYPIGELAHTVKTELERVSYPRPVDVGYAFQGDIAAAGGRDAYFGPDGRRRPPQAPRAC